MDETIRLIETVTIVVLLAVTIGMAWADRIARKEAEEAWNRIGRRQAELRPGHDPASVAYLPTYRGCVMDVMDDPGLRGLIARWDDATARHRRTGDALIRMCLVVCTVCTLISVLNATVLGAERWRGRRTPHPRG